VTSPERAQQRVACTLAPGGGALILFRVFQGFGGARRFATATAIVTSVFWKLGGEWFARYETLARQGRSRVPV
jgi:MFS family permease